jgi:TPR repeat protein
MHTKEDHAALEAKYRPAAEEGNAEAQFELAKMNNSCSCSGTDRKERKKEALRWFQKAAEQGHVDAQYWTGLYYRHGLEVVTKDQAEGDAWFLKAAEQGHTGAMMKLGRYREAAELGDAYAQYQLGNQCKDKDPAEAMSWYLTATSNANGLDGWASTAGKASYEIAKMYEEGKGVPKNDETALAWLFRAAEKGDPEAPWDIARRYAKGMGVPRDAEVAADWYVEAESRGQDFDWYDLKKICKARGIPLEDMLAAYRKAAETCDVWAAYLADLYEYGYGAVTPDKAESQKWLRKAALEFRGHLEDVNTEGGAH